jgi:hypothetical protein
LSHSSPHAERRFLGHPPASDSLCRHSRLQPTHSLEIEANALSDVGAPSPVFGVRWTPLESRDRTFAAFAKAGNASPTPQSNIRLRLLEKLLTCLKSATSFFLIDNFFRHSRPRSSHSPEMEGRALSHVGTLSSAVSAKGENASPLPQSRIRVKLLEIILTHAKSATSLFLIDNFLPHFQFVFTSNPNFSALVLAKESDGVSLNFLPNGAPRSPVRGAWGSSHKESKFKLTHPQRNTAHD